MTKILSSLLEAKEPDFHFGIQKLERASGKESCDIRLTNELMLASREKLRQLGLDAGDTTGPELFQALNLKLAASDKELAKVLRLEPLEPSFLEDFTGAVGALMSDSSCFAIKQSAAKRLFKANPPKRAMKRLGYRSLDSFLKHESLAGVYASAKICESAAWWRSMAASYKKLSPSDFEVRQLIISALSSNKWRDLAREYTEKNRGNIVEVNEAGVVALLPLAGYPPGMITSMFLLTLATANEILAASSYLRLKQVKAGFGEIVADVSARIPSVTNPVSGSRLSWRVVHDFIVGSRSNFEPQLSSEATSLASPADTLAGLSPALEFWRGTGHLAHLSDGRAVSLNPIDAALNCLNNLPYERRVTDYFKQNLWRKLWQSYLQVDIIGEKLLSELRRELEVPEAAPEFALDE